MVKHWDDYFASSAALSARSSDESSRSLCNGETERWISQSTEIDGIPVSAYALLSGFGKGTSFLHYVSQNLVDLFLQSEELREILNEMSKIQANIKYIDDKVIGLLKNLFVNVNADYIEEYETQQRKNSRADSSSELNSWDLIDSISLSDPQLNGCSAILSVILKDRLYIANIGNSTAVLCKQLSEPKESYLFQVSALHEDTKKMTDLHALPNNCFGSYIDEHSNKVETTCEPFVVSQGIQLDHTIQFLMFASPLAVKIVTQLNLDNLDNVNTYLISLVMDDLAQTKSISHSLKNVVQNLVDHYNRITHFSNNPSIAIGYVDLRNNNASDPLENSQEQVEVLNDANTVPSEVDWSEFETNDNRDLFVAIVNSLKPRELSKISEH